jgi:hypothetical protein
MPTNKNQPKRENSTEKSKPPQQANQGLGNGRKGADSANSPKSGEQHGGEQQSGDAVGQRPDNRGEAEIREQENRVTPRGEQGRREQS